MNTISKLGSGIGILYIEDLDGNIISSISNDSDGARQVKSHALTSSPVGYTISGKGSLRVVSILAAGTLINLTIDGVDQLEASTVPLAISGETQAAIDIAEAINSFIPSSGPNYTATAVETEVKITAPTSSGADVNGDVIAVSSTIGVNFVTDIENIDGGSTGDELISTITGAKYYLNPTTEAIAGDVGSPGTEEISEFIINRGTQAQIPILSQNIAAESLANLKRYSQIQVVEVGSSIANNLKTIEGDFAIHDIIIVKNVSAFTITIQDELSGNLRTDPDSFAMINDDYVIWFMYMDDPTDGLIWREIYRKPTTLAAGSVTNTELDDLSVSTAKVQALAITEAKIALGVITNALMASNAIGTVNIIDGAVTTVKILDLAISTAKIALLAVGTAQIADLAITEAKIADGAVTISKVSTQLKQGRVVVPISWETDELGLFEIKMPACTVTEIFLSITKDIAGTDAATFVPKDDSGTIMADGTIDLPALAPIGNNDTSTPTANNVFTDGQSMGLETLKATPGGKAVLTICYTKS
jgi:hypothetical protein